jgi:hypothetical protein
MLAAAILFAWATPSRAQITPEGDMFVVDANGVLVGRKVIQVDPSTGRVLAAGCLNAAQYPAGPCVNLLDRSGFHSVDTLYYVDNVCGALGGPAFFLSSDQRLFGRTAVHPGFPGIIFNEDLSAPLAGNVFTQSEMGTDGICRQKNSAGSFRMAKPFNASFLVPPFRVIIQ